MPRRLDSHPPRAVPPALATAAFCTLLLGLASCTTAPPEPTVPDVAQYLAQGASPWQPEPVQKLANLQPHFVVDAQGRGSHRSIQAAVDAAPHSLEGTATRTVIVIRPGYYPEPLCIRNKAPLLLRGTGMGPAQVRIALSRFSGMAKAPGQIAHPCAALREAKQHGLEGSSTAIVLSDDVALMNLTVANEASEPRRSDRADASPGPAVGLVDATLANTQGVALTLAGDRIQLEGVHLAGHQNTLLARRREASAPARVFVRSSRIEGDVDFVSGNATVVLTQSVLHNRGDRPASRSKGVALAPSTLPEVPFGFLVTQSRFTGDANLAPASVALGRAWDQDVAQGAWRSGQSPNGQALVRDSVLGPHIAQAPSAFASSSSGRQAPSGNAGAGRLWQVRNTALAALP